MALTRPVIWDGASPKSHGGTGGAIVQRQSSKPRRRERGPLQLSAAMAAEQEEAEGAN